MGAGILTCGFPAHLIETAAGTDAADDEEDDEDYDRRHRHANSDRLEVIAVGDLQKNKCPLLQTHFLCTAGLLMRFLSIY